MLLRESAVEKIPGSSTRPQKNGSSTRPPKEKTNGSRNADPSVGKINYDAESSNRNRKLPAIRV